MVNKEKKPYYKLLIIDDEPDLISVIKSRMEHEQYEVYSANNLREGISKCREIKPDVILLDLNLPDSQGIETIKNFRKNYIHGAIVVNTGSYEEEFGAESIAAGAQDYLLKGEDDSVTMCRSIRYSIERKKAEDDLKSSEKRFRSLIQENIDSILIVDKKSFVLFANNAALNIFGRKGEEFIGLEFGLPIVTSEIAEINIPQKNGEIITAEMRSKEVEWENQTAYFVSLHDITQLKQTEQLKAAIGERMRMDKLKDDFVSLVSHELRTPLTTIKAFTSILSKETSGKLTKDQKEYVGIIRGNVDRLTRLVEDLLDISKIEAGKVKMNKTITKIADVVSDVVSVSRTEADVKEIIVKTSFPTKLPNIYLDSDRIVQVFTNLMSNAIKFTPKKGQITVSVEDKETYMECSVTDNGIGIDSEKLDEIFGKFQQLKREPGSGYKGTGLGLAISKGIVEMHNGKIWVESTIKKGSRFIFTIPKCNEQEIVCEQIEECIGEVQGGNKNLLVFIFKLNNYLEKEKQLGAKEIQGLFMKVLETFKSKFRINEFARVNGKDEIIVVVKINKEDESVVNSRIKKALKASFVEIDEEFEINFSYGYSLYPQVADNAKDLLDKATNALVNAKEERLKKKILMVDDESAVRKILRRHLNSIGYDNILEADSGEQALTKIKSAIPDLIILDMNMPKMSGYEIIGRLRGERRTKDIPLLIMSGAEVEVSQLKEYTHEQAIPVIGKTYNKKHIEKLLAYLL